MDPYAGPQHRRMMMEGLPRQCGKTRTLVSAACKLAESVEATTKPKNILYIVPTATVRGFIMEQLHKKWKNCTRESTSTTITHEFGGKITCYLGTFADVKTLNGSRFDAMFLDEYSMFAYRHVWTDALYPAIHNALTPNALVMGLSS